VNNVTMLRARFDALTQFPGDNPPELPKPILGPFSVIVKRRDDTGYIEAFIVGSGGYLLRTCGRMQVACLNVEKFFHSKLEDWTEV
jgi:hypothetical protein